MDRGHAAEVGRAFFTLICYNADYREMKRSRPHNQTATSDGASRAIADDLELQSVCQACGLCCDGTLFEYVLLRAGEQIPRIDEASKTVFGDGQAGITQPCRFYQKRLCAIYDLGRPNSCKAFRCRLLQRYAAGEVSKEEALAEIVETLRRIDRVRQRMQTQVAERERNLTLVFKEWTELQGGCYAAWSSEHEAILAEYQDVLDRLRRSFASS